MSVNVKIVEDTLADAAKILQELQSLLLEVRECEIALVPFKDSGAKTLPQYVAKTRAMLEKANISKFGIYYPALSAVISNGSFDDEGMHRLHDGVYKLGKFNKKLVASKFVIKTDVERTELQAEAKNIRADFIIFIITQYKLTSTTTVLMSVKDYCDRQSISPDIYYGELLLQLEETGEQPYGFEQISPYRQELIDIDPVFVSECEDNFFPLTAELSAQIIDGAVNLVEARAILLEHMKQSEETEVANMNPGNMIKQLNLS